jgi:protein gp37
MSERQRSDAEIDGANAFAEVGKKAAGRLLDGSEWNEMPEMA